MNILEAYLLASAAIMAGGFLILRFLSGREYARRGKLSVATAALQALFFFAYGGFPSIYLHRDWPAVHVGPVAHVIGILLLLAGLGWLFYGMLRLGVLRSMGLGEPRLARQGPYRHSRNPQVLACGLYVLGFVILWPSWYAAGWGLMYVPLIHTMVLTEEAHLRRRHGKAYEAYQRQVPRYIALGRVGSRKQRPPCAKSNNIDPT